MKIQISKLTPHTLNYRIYGHEDDIIDLLEKIKTSGWIKPIMINSRNVIISGHRRVECCKILGITEIEYELVEDDDIKQLELLVNENFYRVKTTTQLMKESEIYFDIEKKKSYKRMMSGVDPKSGVTSGRTTEIVSKKIGMGETTFKKGRKVMEYIKDYPEYEWFFSNTLDQSVDKSVQMTEKPPEFIDKVIEKVGDDKDKILPVIRELELVEMKSEITLPVGRYGVIYIDLTDKSIEPLFHTTLSEISEKDCVLFVWVKPEHLKTGLKVVCEHWDFTYKTCLVWNKDVMNEVSEECELLLVSTRGNPKMIFKETKGNVEKPVFVRDVIKNGYQTSIVELFLGEGWEIW